MDVDAGCADSNCGKALIFLRFDPHDARVTQVAESSKKIPMGEFLLSLAGAGFVSLD